MQCQCRFQRLPCDTLTFALNPAQALFAVSEVPAGFEWVEKLYCVNQVHKAMVALKPFNEEDFVPMGVRSIAYTPCLENSDFSGFVRYVFDLDSNGG